MPFYECPGCSPRCPNPLSESENESVLEISKHRPHGKVLEESFPPGHILPCTETTYELPSDRFWKNYALEGVENVSSRSLCICGRMTLVSRVPLTGSPFVEGRFSQTVLTARLFLNRRKTLDFIWYTISGGRLCSVSRNRSAELWFGPSRSCWYDRCEGQLVGNRPEADVYRAPYGRFGTVPYPCSYEGMGGHRGVAQCQSLTGKASHGTTDQPLDDHQSS